MNKIKAGLVGIVMALAGAISTGEMEAGPRRHNSWSNYNLRTFYGYPQFQPQKWNQPIPNTYMQNLQNQKNRTTFYQLTDAVYDIYEAGWPAVITVINKEGKVRILQRTTMCQQGGNCAKGTELPHLDGPKKFMVAQIGWHYKIVYKQK